MSDDRYALVLTGSTLPGHAPESVWPALATYFRMDAEKLATQLVARAPLTIKQSDDLGKLQTLQAGIAALGAEAEVCAPDSRPALFVLLDRAPRGPVPHVFVEKQVEHGVWAASLQVAEVGSKVWRAYAETVPPPASAAPAEPPAPDIFSERPSQTASIVVQPLPQPRETVVRVARGDVPLPSGEAIHAGFWRRCAAMVIDGFLLGIVSAIVQGFIGVGMLGSIRADGSIDAGTVFMMMALPFVVLFVGQWLYFALFECSGAQATPGKMALGIKVVDENAQRIGFGRASGRYFGKLVSSLILNLGYVMAGLTARKQALHDLMAGTFVVFGDVQPGRPLPTERPPMPWYGWLLNILVVGGLALAIVAFVGYGAMLFGNLTGYGG